MKLGQAIARHLPLFVFEFLYFLASSCINMFLLKKGKILKQILGFYICFDSSYWALKFSLNCWKIFFCCWNSHKNKVKFLQSFQILDYQSNPTIDYPVRFLLVLVLMVTGRFLSFTRVWNTKCLFTSLLLKFKRMYRILSCMVG